jgi:hypothetical protein
MCELITTLGFNFDVIVYGGFSHPTFGDLILINGELVDDWFTIGVRLMIG